MVPFSMYYPHTCISDEYVYGITPPFICTLYLNVPALYVVNTFNSYAKVLKSKAYREEQLMCIIYNKILTENQYIIQNLTLYIRWLQVKTAGGQAGVAIHGVHWAGLLCDPVFVSGHRD